MSFVHRVYRIQAHRHRHSSPRPLLWTRILGKKVIFVRPHLDYELARHSKDMSLASFASITLCRPIFGISDAGVTYLRQIDTKPAWHAAFIDPERGNAVMNSALRHVEAHFQNRESKTETNFGAWLFSTSAGATAHSLWGSDNPWLESSGLMNDF